MTIFRFFDFRRSKKHTQTWETVEPAKNFGFNEMPEGSIRSHLVSPIVKGGAKSRLFIQPLNTGFQRGSTYVTDGKAYGVDQPDRPVQVEARRRCFAGVFSKIASIRDARSEEGK
ncbi:hypothetical protein [Agrobacterium tumefaciens]|uniref:hypothetical protein n=1 Tax=Agrobacterium tumefaciens TaxID=358 RepID=UPI001574A5DA|nr:hypothetical protein [Agrobacterium tumefaciens]